MTSIFGSPATYVQGIHALQDSYQYIERLGSKALVLADTVVLKIVGNDYIDYLTKNGLAVKKVQFRGEASENEINRVDEIGKDFGADLIIALGGGKTLDSAKAIADVGLHRCAMFPVIRALHG